MGVFKQKVQEQSRWKPKRVVLVVGAVLVFGAVFLSNGSGDADESSAQVTTTQQPVSTQQWPGSVSGRPSGTAVAGTTAQTTERVQEAAIEPGPIAPERPLDEALPGTSLTSIPKGVQAAVPDPILGAAVLDEIADQARDYGKSTVASYLVETAAKWRVKGY